MKVLQVVCLAVCLVSGAGSQLQAQAIDPGDLMRLVGQGQRELVIAKNMGLDKKKMQAFWTVYEKYRGEMIVQGDRSEKLIFTYASSHQKLTQKEAASMLEEFLSIEQEKLGIKQKYVSQFRKVLKPKQALRFYQIENKLDAILWNDLANRIPLAQ